MLGLLILGLFLGIFRAIPIAVIAVASQGKAKDRAYVLLAEPSPDPKEVRKIIRTLSSSKSTEHQELVRKLMALI